MQDKEWVATILGGDNGAFANIVDRYQHAVYNLAYRMLGNGEEAADAAQETFLRAYAQLATYDPARPFASWLLAIDAHHCLDWLRKRRATIVPLASADAVVDGQAGPEDTLLVNERRRAVRGLLDCLSPGYRLVVVLRYWYDLSCMEIAAVAGLSETAVKTRLHRARAVMVDAIDHSDELVWQLAVARGERSLNDIEKRSHERTMHSGAPDALAAPRRDARRAGGGPSDEASWQLRVLPSVFAGAR